MKNMKSTAIVIALVALAGLMVFTNPTKDDLSDFIRQHIMKESQKKIKVPEGQLLSTFLGGLAGDVISSQTIRTDYVLFSTYEVQFGKERFKALGIFRNFVQIRRSNKPIL